MKVSYVLINHMLATSMTWPSEMWAAAAQYSRIQHSRLKAIKPTLIAQDMAPVMAHGGLRFMPEITFNSTDNTSNKNPEKEHDKQEIFDLVYVPALWRNPQKVIHQSNGLIEWLQYQYENGALLCAVGTGVCLIAETGLLNQKPATTHWYFFDQFKKRYPDIHLKRQHFITEADPIYCAASINSLADLTIHFIQRVYGIPVAQHIERHFSHEIRRAYDQTSFIDKKNQNHPDESILQAQLWMKDNLAEPITTQQLANQHDMSTRNFTRRFLSATAMSPMQYLQNIRIDTAQDLLQYSNLNIAEISERTGFNDLSYFAKVFRKQRSISPSEYRKTVRAKLFSQATEPEKNTL